MCDSNHTYGSSQVIIGHFSTVCLANADVENEKYEYLFPFGSFLPSLACSAAHERVAARMGERLVVTVFLCSYVTCCSVVCICSLHSAST